MGNIRCPRCRKMINEKDKKCCYCGFDGIDSYISAIKRKEQEEKKDIIIHDSMTSNLAKNNSDDSWKGLFILWGIVIIAFWLLWSCWSCAGNSDRKCKVCDGTGYYQKKTCVFCDGTGEYNSSKDPYKSYKELYDD